MRTNDGCFEFKRVKKGKYYCLAIGLYAIRTDKDSWCLEFPLPTNFIFSSPQYQLCSLAVDGFHSLKEAMAFKVYDSIISLSYSKPPHIKKILSKSFFP